jgi:NB-ARC domain-containing protein
VARRTSCSITARAPADARLHDADQQAKVAFLLARFRQGGDLVGLVQDFTGEQDLRDKLGIGLLQVIEKDFKPALADLRRERERVYLFDGSLTNQYVPRPEAFDLLRRTLLGSRAHVGVVAETALQGMGGIGKTVLARAVCEDPSVLGAFPDCVLWATLGERARPLDQARRWMRALGSDVRAVTTIQ